MRRKSAPTPFCFVFVFRRTGTQSSLRAVFVAALLLLAVKTHRLPKKMKNMPISTMSRSMALAPRLRSRK